jgi:hemerythrin
VASVAWRPEYSTGIAAMDVQHHKLFGLLNMLHDAMEGQTEVEAGQLMFILNQLMNYTLVHFRDEEELMRSHGFPGLEAHIQVHRRLVARLQTQIQAHERCELDAQALSTFLGEWIVGHVVAEDKQYGSFLATSSALTPQDTTTWNARFVTGVESLDERTRMLCEVLDHLFLSIKLNGAKAQQECETITAAFRHYIAFHFSEEEGLMVRLSYAGMTEHRVQHENFLRKLDLLLSQLRGGSLTAARVGLFIHAWLSHHIQHSDADLGRHAAQSYARGTAHNSFAAQRGAMQSKS